MESRDFGLKEFPPFVVMAGFLSRIARLAYCGALN